MARVLLGVTGGIAAYKSALLVRSLRARGHEVRCALSRAASAFVSPLTLEVLSGEPVHSEEYLTPTGTGQELHITLAEWADAVCVAPATTHFLARLAHGFGDDFLTTTLLAYRGPVVVAPAMHTEMWSKATTREAVAELDRRSVTVVGPEVGALASGEVGVGRMADVELIVDAVERAVIAQDYAGRRVVITAGPTHEPIDPVRFVANRSSGLMGFSLARAAALRGARVDLVAGPVALPTPSFVDRLDVTTALEMEQALSVASGADLVIMCAAVADYRLQDPPLQKIKRAQRQTMKLELVANPDLLAGLANRAPDALRVGFAAETGGLEENAQAKLVAKRAHFLCANDVSRVDIGFESADNELMVFDDRGGRIVLAKDSKLNLAHQLLDLFKTRWDQGERRPAGE